MSASRRFRRQRAKAMQSAALKACRVGGCSCKPDISARGMHVFARHDTWCPLADANTWLLVLRPDDGCRR